MSSFLNPKEELFIIKIGGNVIDDSPKLDSFLKDFASINHRKILVHGGGKIATTIGEKLGIESKYIDGRRITDDKTIDLVTMVYGGLINKQIVAKLQSAHCNAIGITGADGDLIPAKKRPVKEIDYGWVGDIIPENINVTNWQLFLDNGFTPVASPLTHDNEGHILNTNADTIASVIAIALSSLYNANLVFCFEKDGVLENVNDEHSVINKLSFDDYLGLRKKGGLFAGILPKIDNAFDAIHNGVGRVAIGNFAHLSSLINGSRGTKISL